jgi:hypothetical protein
MIRKARYRNQCLDDLREFVESGWESAEVVTRPDNMRSIYNTYYQTAKRHRSEFHVKVIARQCKVYLVRVES